MLRAGDQRLTTTAKGYLMTILMCLATAIFFEARDQPVMGQFAVAGVILTRREHERFPDTVCDVVFTGKAFSFTHDGISDDMYRFTSYEDVMAIELSLIIAQEVLSMGGSIRYDYTHYHTMHVSPFWSDHKDFHKGLTIGDHVFYTCDNYC